MNYANANIHNGDRCCHCDEPISAHAINIIRSNDETLHLARALQDKLDAVCETALTKGYTLPQEMIMTGAIVATVGSTVIKAAALSGGNAQTILNIMQGNLGKDVELLGDNVDIASIKSILGVKLSGLANKVEQSRGRTFVPPLPGIIPDPNYPVGSCAAQKLLHYVVQYALAHKQKISTINMTEIFWKTNGVKSKWSTGSEVPSCNTCQYILPMMLCNYDDMRDKCPYP